MFRRRLIGGAVVAVLILAAVSTALAWRQYRDDQHRAVSDLGSRVVLVGAAVNSYLAGGVSTLGAMSEAPSVIQANPKLMSAYFKRVAASGGTIFTGGIGWVDRSGHAVASSNGGPPVDVSDRVYFKRVMATGRPYISAGLVGRKLRQPIVVVAVPTRDAAGRPSGVLTGAIRLTTLGQAKQTQSLGMDGLTIVDRDGQLLLSGLAHASNGTLLARIRELGTGHLTDAPGLESGDHHVIVFTAAKVPGWTIAIDRPSSSVYASARRSLTLEAVSLGAALLAVLLILGLLVKRSRREIETRGEQAQSWSKYTRTLALASTPADIADIVLESVQEVFPDAVVVVTLDSEGGQETRATSRLPGWRRVAGDSVWLRSIAGLTTEGGPVTRSLERDRTLRDLYLAFGRRLKALHAYPVSGRAGAPVGGIALLTERPRLAKSEWELLGAFGAQAGQSLERARAFEHEHELAVRLQQSLLPADLPSAPGLSLAGVYLAGGDGIAVGGDWYDALLRPDGILQLCVGDVSGRGVGAATVMGRMRGTFRAYAYDLVSPAEILRRMLRHVNEDEMITAVCVSIDPLEGVLSYSSAGHPPPLLLDSDAGRVTRLEQAGAPPLGVAEPSDLIEEKVRLPDRALLAMYTDGLVERRGESIDEGIDVLGETMLGASSLTGREAMAAISAAIGAPSDDVALLLSAIEPAQAFVIELPAVPENLRVIRRRLGAWLQRVGFEEGAAAEIVLAVSEACNNAVEHAYNGNGPGGVSLSATLVADVLHLEIADGGRWVVNEPSDERGRGIHLMNGLMDKVEIEAGAQGTRILLERRRGAAQPDGATPLAT